ncbi:HNH endonuclease [Sphingomonas oryzagri]
MVETISRFFSDRLQVPFNNDRWSWGAYDADHNRVFLRVWEHGFSDDKTTMEVLWDDDPRTNAGANERRRHVERIAEGAQAFGVLCVRHDGLGENRIKSFDAARLLLLGKPEHVGDRWVSPVLGKIDVHEIDALKNLGNAEESEIWANGQLTETEKKNLIAARRGQGIYRRRLLEAWDNRCAVTGCSILDAVRASHSKPWAVSSNAERLDPHNGLPLIATLDALFDRGLIGFSSSGDMLVSGRIDSEQRALIGLPQPLRKKPGKRCAAYLEWHSVERFKA